MAVSSRYRRSRLSSHNEYDIGFSEGGWIAVRPDNPNILYIGDHHWMSKYDKRTGMRYYIGPRDENNYGWGTADNQRHGRKPARDYDHYLDERLFYDCAGWVGPVDTARQGIEWIEFGLMEVPASRVVFATDYPQAIRTDQDCKDYTDAVRALGEVGETILTGITAKLIPALAQGA